MNLSSAENLASLNKVKDILVNLQQQKEAYWKQKATCNYIHKISTPEGRYDESPYLIYDSGVKYFKEVFNNNFTLALDLDFSFILSLVSEEDNIMLTKIPSEKEIESIIKEMKTNSMAGPDSFTSKFHKKTWYIIKEDLINAVVDFFKGLVDKYGFLHKKLPLKYLGTTLYKGRKRSHLFGDICFNIYKRLSTWDFNFLSSGGRLVLIKSVICSIPIYLFHTLFLNKITYTELERILKNFLWGAKHSKSTILWASWDRCSGVQDEGKLGFKNLSDMALGFSNKLWFNLRSKKSLWLKFMITKYCVGKHPLNLFFKKGNSFNWKRLCSIKWDVENFIQWGLGCGYIFFWQDNWLGFYYIYILVNTHTNSACKVANFIQEGTSNLNYLAEMVHDFVINLILNVLLHLDQKDCILFNKSNDGSFAFKEIFNNYIPVDTILMKKGFYMVSKCQCCYHIENLNHVFANGHVSLKVWLYFDNVLTTQFCKNYNNIINIMHDWVVPIKRHIRNMLPTIICWFLWKSRNEAKHENITMKASYIVLKIKGKDLGGTYIFFVPSIGMPCLTIIQSSAIFVLHILVPKHNFYHKGLYAGFFWLSEFSHVALNNREPSSLSSFDL
ncbi:hypothetical protein M5K25_012949 [Dendrobium thyrsiflorum]|uniref:Uncharacterized protein n=1 Tax=Dendrobium thyrsiflorum TaxID=117978 RepID=A0ABD0UYR2_DENTH